MTKKYRKTKVALGCGLLMGVVLLLGWDTKLQVVTHQVKTSKLTAPLRLLLLSDLHSCRYGEGQSELLAAIAAQKPDLILLAGDILDDEMPHQPGKEFLRAIGAQYDCYYVPGNHEHMTGELNELLRFVKSCGIKIPLGSCESVQSAAGPLQICGIDDPWFLGEESVLAQAERVSELCNSEAFSILLSHRPELFDQISFMGFDLVVAGHAHGGQWRFPGGNGVYAPHQGVMPRYSGGLYEAQESSMVLSRGLARESTRVPRLFNPPEITVIEVLPEA